MPHNSIQIKIECFSLNRICIVVLKQCSSGQNCNTIASEANSVDDIRESGLLLDVTFLVVHLQQLGHCRAVTLTL